MIVVILPAYNEEDAIVPLIYSILDVAIKRLGEPVAIVVVDDGSTDTTASRVVDIGSPDVFLVQHEQNKGLGEALKTGLLSALDLSPDVNIVVTMDSDNTHTPGLLHRMIMCLDEGNDVVIASRYRSGSRVIGLSLYRQMLSTAMSVLFRVLFPIAGVRDYSCGYRAYRAQLLREAFKRWGTNFINQSGFGCMVDVLLKLDRIGAIMTEVPLILRYDYKKGKSKMRVLKTIRETMILAYNEKIERLKKRDKRDVLRANLRK